MLKKTLLTVLIAVSSSPLVAIAGMDGLSGAPAPIQSYHTDTAPAQPKSDAVAMAQVQAIMAKAKAQAEQAKAQAAPVTAATAPAPSPSTPPTVMASVQTAKTPGVYAENNQDLAGQVSTMNQTNLMYEQRTDQKIEALSSKNQELTEQLTRMGQALTLLNQEVVQLNSAIQQIKPSQLMNAPQASSKWAELKPEFMNGFSYLIYAVLAALLVIILLMLPWYRRKDQRVLAPSAASVPNEGEYDFMGTHEAIPAKLDLARAYLAMEDHEAAVQVLAEVQQDGNPTQRAEAQKMLESINKKS